MFFLLRMAFWLGLVLVLLPRDKTPGSEKLPQIGAQQAVTAATAAMSDVIGQRATDGARKLYQIITDKRGSDHTGAIGGVAEQPNWAAPADTLTAQDLQAEWHLEPPQTTSAN
jgi:hypothetical protein